MTGDGWRPRVVVCGTGFGRVYLSALRRPDLPFDLVGIVARGSVRSRACAAYYEVPLYTDVDELHDVDIACVVVGGALNGGPGAELAGRLLARGVHVLQEHPLHRTELAANLRLARRHRVQYQVTSHYPYVPAVRRFVEAARRLRRHQPVLFVDALTSFQVLYPLFDLLGAALGGLRPWSVDTTPPGSGVLRTVNGVLAGVPLTLRIQNELDPVARDNGAHLAHRITLATEGGTLLLANTHGPVLWTPRLHMPADYASVVTVADSTAGDLDLPGVAYVGSPYAPSYRAVIGDEWPLAVAEALLDLRSAVLHRRDPLPLGQHHLALCDLTAEVAARLGPPDLRPGAPPRVAEATAAVGGYVDGEVRTTDARAAEHAAVRSAHG